MDDYGAISDIEVQGYLGRTIVGTWVCPVRYLFRFDMQVGEESFHE